MRGEQGARQEVVGLSFKQHFTNVNIFVYIGRGQKCAPEGCFIKFAHESRDQTNSS